MVSDSADLFVMFYRKNAFISGVYLFACLFLLRSIERHQDIEAIGDSSQAVLDWDPMDRGCRRGTVAVGKRWRCEMEA